MIHRAIATVFIVLLAGVGTSACGSKKKPARDAESVVPEETQKRSKDNYGQQQNSMDALNMSPSEQAGAQHQGAVERGRGVDRSDDDEK